MFTCVFITSEPSLLEDNNRQTDDGPTDQTTDRRTDQQTDISVKDGKREVTLPKISIYRTHKRRH